MEKKISERIITEKSKDGGLTVKIFPAVKKNEQQSLLVWLVLFSACGLFILSSLFVNDFKSEELLMIGIFLVFWSYFEFKVLYAYRWLKMGKEVIEIKEGHFYYMKQISKRGIPTCVPLSEISKFSYTNDALSGFWGEINKSVFMVGGEVVEYKSGESIKRLGMKLEQKDAEKVVEVLNRFIK